MAWQHISPEMTVKGMMETMTLIVKVHRILHALCNKCMKVTVKYFFLADILYFGGLS